ncbi:hypothetical protein HPB47_027692 [Ixodes persulcatus]|uniref:Uncharacterized protein n=1 Tax=Ixodes persulcatus TaxID=34615 RepID=A0AC60PVU3_IXOPE|nr:hypothetical protein HPB47_027692 [Ixodes persulcatus]
MLLREAAPPAPDGRAAGESIDSQLRETWLKVVARKDWVPNTTSRSSVVCSRHFLTTDYNEGCETRKLKRGNGKLPFFALPWLPRLLPSNTLQRAFFTEVTTASKCVQMFQVVTPVMKSNHNPRKGRQKMKVPRWMCAAPCRSWNARSDDEESET